MDKERLMQFLSDAIDAGMRIEVIYQELYAEKSQAKESAQRLSDIIGGEVKTVAVDGSTWYEVENNNIRGTLFKPAFERVEGKLVAIRPR